MADRSKIEWTDSTWNPIRARNRATGRPGHFCTHASEGCRFCYAERINHRLGTGIDYRAQNGGQVEIYLDEQVLQQPLHWRRPRRIFVGSMTDLFGAFASAAMLDRVFAVMALAGQHQYLLLTKRGSRMRDYVADRSDGCGYWEHWAKKMLRERSRDPGKPVMVGKTLAGTWPWPHCWLGVSIEDQPTADERIPELLATPAAVRFVSAEPLLGGIDLSAGGAKALPIYWEGTPADGPLPTYTLAGDGFHRGPDMVRRGWVRHSPAGPALDWVIVGGESGPGARPMHIAWARSIVAQCKAASVACFVKQLGANPQTSDGLSEGSRALPIKDRRSGDWSEWPEDLKVREFPRAQAISSSPSAVEEEGR